MFCVSRITTARYVLTLIVWSGLVLTPIIGWSEDAVSLPEARVIVQCGTIEAGAIAGYLQGLALVPGDSANRSAFYLMPRIGTVVTDQLGGGYLTGNVTLMVEPLYAAYFRPIRAIAAGGALVVRYNLLSFGRWMPYCDMGGGAIWTDFAPRITEQSTPVNFLLEAGPGLQYFATDRIALTVGTRYHHISNANSVERNHGLNSILTSVGLAFFFPS